MKLAIVISFLNEGKYLPRLLESMNAQTDPPDVLLLVDDGSSDGSREFAEQFAESHTYARYLRRPKRPQEPDRLVSAPELQAFVWGAKQLDVDCDIICKMDGDLKLPTSLLADVRKQFEERPRLGLTGSILSVSDEDGGLAHEHNPVHHVRGPNKFYRRECFEQISPVPAFLGWDTIDEIHARMLGWETRAFVPSAGHTIHLRPTGSHDGRLRAYRRWGRCAWGYGAHPLVVTLGSVRRMQEKPYGLGGIQYFFGWVNAAVRRYPRAEPTLRRWCWREDKARIRRRLRDL